MPTAQRARRCRARSWRRSIVLGPWALGAGLLLSGCQAVLDIDDYSFDGGVRQTPGLPLKPADDGGAPPSRPPVSDPSDAGAGEETIVPPVVVAPGDQPRPVVVDDADLVFGLAGNSEGGQPRTATCPGGVVEGLVLQYWTTPALAAGLVSFVYPLCNSLFPTTPLLTSGVGYSPEWSNAGTNDPIFSGLRENETLQVLACPEGQYLVGIDGTFDDPVAQSTGFRSLGIRCASLGSDVERSDVVYVDGSGQSFPVAPAPGVFPFAQQCPEGRVGNQIDLRFGDWLDAVGMGCSLVRWPFTAGHACSGPDECQSGSCGNDRFCALQ